MTHELEQWDPGLTRHAVDMLRPVVKVYHHSEVRGLERIPQGRCLLVDAGRSRPAGPHAQMMDSWTTGKDVG